MIFNKLVDYVAQRQNNVKSLLTEDFILLGSKRQKIIHFATFQEFHKNLDDATEKTKELVRRAKGKLIINGNLKEAIVLQLVNFSLREKIPFTVVVNDGYRLSRRKKPEECQDLAIIIEGME